MLVGVYVAHSDLVRLRVSPLSFIPVAAGAPSHWDPVDSAHGNRTLVLLSPENPRHVAELKQVHDRWTRTGGQGTIASVHRVQNSHLHARFEDWKCRHSSQHHKELTVYYGTSRTAPSLIHEGSAGFDPKFAEALPGYLWFAENGQRDRPSIELAAWTASVVAHLPLLLGLFASSAVHIAWLCALGQLRKLL